jgi:hypothetical protein
VLKVKLEQLVFKDRKDRKDKLEQLELKEQLEQLVQAVLGPLVFKDQLEPLVLVEVLLMSLSV